MHESWQDMLPLYVNDGLTPEDRQALEAHLADCEECRARLWGFRMLAQAAAEEAEIEALQETLPPLILPVNSHTPQKPKHSQWRKNTMFVSMTRPTTQPQGIFAPLKRIMAGLMISEADRRKVSALPYAVTIAMLVVVIAVMIAIGSQPGDDTNLTVLPIPSQQDAAEVDCLADRAYRVVYAEELPNLTTEDLKCAFIVGDMRGLDISHLDFSDTVMRDVNMSGMELGRKIFRGATLIDGNLSDTTLNRANFSRANLIDVDLSLSDLSGATFVEASLRETVMRGTDMTSVRATGASLIRTDLSCADDLVITEATPEATETAGEVVDCKNPTNLTNASLTEAHIHESDLSYADLSRSSGVSAAVSRTDLKNANLTGAEFRLSFMSYVDMRNANFTRTNFFYTHFFEAQIDEADFTEVSLGGASFNNRSIIIADDVKLTGLNNKLEGLLMWGMRLTRPDLSGAELSESHIWLMELIEANLTNSDMSRSVIKESEFIDSNLTNSDLSRANLIDVDFANSDLTGVDLTGAAFTDVVWTDVTLPDGTLWTEETDLTRFTNVDHADYWRSDDPDSPAFGGE